jgi:threonine dehydrogenase-like Zn-dependent dehydrogenase
MPGCDVELIDINPARQSTARALGVGFAQPDDASPDADVVIHASGSSEGLQLALRVAAFEARIIELSWYGSQTVPVPLGEAFHVRRLTIASSQVGTIAAAQRSRWDSRRRMRLALAELSNPVLDVLITGESEFEALPDVMSQLAATPGDALCHRIRYPQDSADVRK